MQPPLTIVVGGYIIGYPLGGMTWHHLNYLCGLHALGHEVVFLEDSGSYSLPYNPTNWTSSPDSSYGREYLERTFRQFDLPIRYCYFSEFENRHYGLNEAELHEILGRADLLLCVSGVTPLRANRPRPRRMAVIDTDPVFTQLRMRHDRDFLNYYRQFDAVATFGRLIGTADCPLPTHGLNWIATNQPIALQHWPVQQAAGRRFSTVGKWEHSSERDLEFDGRIFKSSKATQWMKMINLPGRTDWPMSIAMAGMTANAKERFAQFGWHVLDAEAITSSCESFRRFIGESSGEFTVAKEIYSGLPSGWFSDRSAAYLASGKPVVTEASGFDRWLPIGAGLFSYQSVDEAAAALQTIAEDYPGHCAAARDLAEKYFDSNLVLSELLRQVL